MLRRLQQVLDIAKILGYGVIGLGFLLAVLAARLLSEAQRLKLGKSHSTRIYIFMVFAVVLCIVGLITPLMPAGEPRRELKADEHSQTNSSINAETPDAKQSDSILRFRQGTGRIVVFIPSSEEVKYPQSSPNGESQTAFVFKDLPDLYKLIENNNNRKPKQVISWFDADDQSSLVQDDVVVLGGPIRNAAFGRIRQKLLAALPRAFQHNLPFDFSNHVYSRKSHIPLTRRTES